MEGRRLFPLSTNSASQANPAIRWPLRQPGNLLRVLRWLSPWLLLSAASLLFFSRLSLPLLEPEETRYAEIPRQMLAEGRLLTPVWHGEPYLHKPPLLYWLVMALYSFLGVQDWVARLIPSAAGFLVVLLTYWWTRRSLGPRAAFWSGLILCLSPRFIYQARLLTLDSLLCLEVMAALAAGYTALGNNKLRRSARRPKFWSWWLLSAIACGLGVLTKGPVALLLVAGPLALWGRLNCRGCQPGWKGWGMYLAMTAVVAGPWYLALAVSDPASAKAFFWQHNVVRFLAPFDHEEPVWFYLPLLLFGMLPWSILLLPAARDLIRRRGRLWRGPLGFVVLTFCGCLVFFSLSGCKRPGYILPCYPLLAVVLGQWLARFLRTRRWAPRQRCAAQVGWGVAGTLGFALLFIAVHEALPGYHRKFGMRGQVRCQQSELADPAIPVACYPRRWDSVSYYLRRNDVRVYDQEHRAELFAAAEKVERTFVFVKTQRHLAEFLRQLPATLEFVPCRQGGNVTSGWLRHRSPTVGEAARLPGS